MCKAFPTEQVKEIQFIVMDQPDSFLDRWLLIRLNVEFNKKVAKANTSVSNNPERMTLKKE